MHKEIEKKINKNTKIVVEMRFNDECKNGHDTFAITGTIYQKPSYRNSFDEEKDWVAGGCIHDEIRKHFPELSKYIKWQLCSTDGPMHYVANTVYHAGDRDCWGNSGKKERDLDAARSTAIWEDATDEELCLPPEQLKAKLEARLPKLLEDFNHDMEELFS